MAKKKSKLKKALLAGAALAGGLALAKNRRRASISGMDDAGIHVRHNAMKDFGPYTHKFADHSIPRYDAQGNLFKGGGIAKRGTGVALKSGGRVKSMGIAKRGGGVAKR